MAPALLDGDLLLAAKGLPPKKGQMVVARHPDGFEMVKRVSAGPGDEAMPGWVLSGDEWLVVGDNREASTDSRLFGALPSGAILGRVLWRLPRIRA